MQLNTIKPADGAKKARRRVGRGIGAAIIHDENLDRAILGSAPGSEAVERPRQTNRLVVGRHDHGQVESRPGRRSSVWKRQDRGD